MTEKKRATYLNVTQQFALEMAIAPMWGMFRTWGHVGIYQVGSSLERPNWRDVDVRMMMEDAAFDKVFDKTFSKHHLFFNATVSKWLSDATGLPVDFQFQRMTDANAEHHGPRNAIGIRLEVEA